MEIHAPEHPIHSFKDFAVHMLVVTCGILIALGLDGVREAVHNRHLVRETREGIREEMQENGEHAKLEMARVSDYRNKLAALLKDLPATEQT